jgi:hypothetical protein
LTLCKKKGKKKINGYAMPPAVKIVEKTTAKGVAVKCARRTQGQTKSLKAAK